MKKALTAACAVTILVALSAQNAAGQGQRNGNGNSRSDAVAEPGELLVQFKANANDAHKNKALGKIKGEELEKVKDKKNRSDGRGDLVLVKHQPDVTQQEAVAILQADPAVEFAEPNWIYTHQAGSERSLLHQWPAVGALRTQDRAIESLRERRLRPAWSRAVTPAIPTAGTRCGD